MIVSITTGCCVCSKPVKVEIEEWYALPRLSIRVFCPDCIGKEPKTIERIMYRGTEIYVRNRT